MTPEIGLLSATQFNWPVFRATIDKSLNMRPDIDINKLPVDFSEDALVLLNIAAYYGWPIENPLNVLRDIPPLFMQYLQYSFFIACDHVTWSEFNPDSNIIIVSQELPECLLLIATGTLNNWYQSIVTNLGRDWEFSHETRFLFDKILITFERERGLGFVFEKYKKKMQSDQTFLLEKK